MHLLATLRIESTRNSSDKPAHAERSLSLILSAAWMYTKYGKYTDKSSQWSIQHNSNYSMNCL